MENYINIFWEKRSKIYGTKITGVLPKSFPLPVNDYLHHWMFEQIERLIPKKKNLTILDLGCGYGRLSQEVLQKFPDVKTVGIDISPTYVELYNKNLLPRGRAVLGDVRKLPFPDQEFDLVFMVTTLMYVTAKFDQKIVLKEIFRVLKAEGKFVFIERNPIGARIVTGGGLVTKLRGKKHQEIPSTSFSYNYLSGLIKASGGKINKFSGIPVFTLLLPILIITSLINNFLSQRVKLGLSQKLISLVWLLDQKLNTLLTPSLYISYSGIKK